MSRLGLFLPCALALSFACFGCDKDKDEPEADQQLTAAECEAKGGKVIGDIGDGAIHRPDFVCPDSGEPPIGTIKADKGGPVAVEGSVCCK